MRPEFQRALDSAMVQFRGSKQNAVYGVFDQFSWDVTEDEVTYAAQKAGFKLGWVYYHTGPRLQESRATYVEARKAYAEAQSQREARKAQERQQNWTREQQQRELERLRAQEQRQNWARQAQMEEALRSQFEWLFRQGMRAAQGSQVAADGCPGYIEPMVRRFGLKWPFTAAELKKVYRRKCMETHPDKGGSAEAFHQVQKDNQELERYAQGAA